jgi:hypothetical protein
VRYWQVYAIFPNNHRSGSTFYNPREAEEFFNFNVNEQRFLSPYGIKGDNATAIVWTFHDTEPGGTSGVVKKWERETKPL